MMKSSWSKCSGYFLNYYQIAGVDSIIVLAGKGVFEKQH